MRNWLGVCVVLLVGVLPAQTVTRVQGTDSSGVSTLGDAVNVTGWVLGQNLSGTNTGDQLAWYMVSTGSGSITPSSTTSTLTIAGGGIVTTSATGSTVTVSATEVDGSVTNEIQNVYTTVTGNTGTTTASTSTDSLAITGSGIASVAVTNDSVVVTATEVDGSTTNELQNLWATVAGDTGSTTANSQTDTLTIAGAGIASTAVSGDTLTVTATEVDGSTSNEIQTFTFNAPSGTDPALTGVTDTLNLAASGIVSITGDSGSKTLTIGATEVDGSTTNEIQNLFETVATTSGTSPVADSPTDTLTLSAGTGITVTGNASTDTVTIAATIAGANPSATVNGTATNGSAGTYMRSDGAPALADPFTPSDGTQNITGALTTSGKLEGSNLFTDSGLFAKTVLGVGSNASLGNSTTAVGYQAVANASYVGGLNTVVGHQAGFAMTNGAGNTLVGYKAGNALTSGANNVFVGMNAGFSATTDGSLQGFNILIGKDAGYKAVGLSQTVGVGWQVGRYMTSDTASVMIGESAGLTVRGGHGHVLIGSDAGRSDSDDTSSGKGIKDAQNMIAIGQNAGTTTDGSSNPLDQNGSESMAFGSNTDWGSSTAFRRYVFGDSAKGTEDNQFMMGTATEHVMIPGTIKFEGATDDANEGTLASADVSADRTWTLPNATGTVALTSDIPAAANPSATIGLSATNGVASTFMRSDAAPALSQSITPTWTGAHTFSSSVAMNGSVTVGDASGDPLAINSGAPTLPNVSTGTDTYFLTLDSGNVIRKEAIGFDSGGSIDLTGASMQVVNGLVTSIVVAECPYVYISVDNKDLRVGEIIRNLNSKEKEGTDVLMLPVLTNKIQIRELKDEVSYIDGVSLVVSRLGGGRTILRAKLDELKSDDGRYYVLRNGDSIEVTFPKLPKDAVMASVLATGYYERVTK